MSTADKSTLPSAVASRSTIHHSLSSNSARPSVISGEDLKSSEEESTWVPELPPRPRQLAMSSKDLSEGFVPLAYEADGSCGRSSPYRYTNTLERNRKPLPQRSSPPHHLWSKDVKFLLDDVEGVNLFTSFLQDHCDQLELEKLQFCFACAGLKTQEPESVQQIVRAIYKKYFRERNLGFPAEMRERLSHQINERSTLRRNTSLKSIFEEAYAFMLDMISKTSYLAFLNSPLCLNYSLSMPINDRDGSASSSSSSVKDDHELGYMTNSLSTVHEGKELVTKTPVKLPLTRDALLKTQSRRLETAPKMLPSPYHTKTIHPQYISCNPVSSQDSDARTESDLSITDGSMDGTSSLSRFVRRSNHKNLNEGKKLNKDNVMVGQVPLTQKENRQLPLPTNELLYEAAAKLEEYAKKLESEELLKKKLEASDIVPERKDLNETLRPDDLRAELVKVINKDALQLVEENSQDILDKHCKRVFSSDQTPVETPNPKSPPRNKSPELPCRRSRSAFNSTSTSLSLSNSMAPPPVPAHGISSYPYNTSRSSRKKDKDGISIVSVDSGNIHDLSEGSEHYHYSPSHSSHYLPKSKSMPDYAHSLDQPKPDSTFMNTSHRSSSRWWNSKKPGDLTDSGVSVVSDTPPVIPFKDKNRLRTFATSSSGSKTLPQRSISSEQCHSLKRLPHSVPIQPFMADSSMPLHDVPYSFAQSDEVSRRLSESNADRCRNFRPRHMGSSKGADLPQSSYPSTLRRSMASQSNMMPPSDKPPMQYSASSSATGDDNCTIVVYSFCNDEVPYRTKIPSNPVTLKQFKDFLPKKGAFRYFFKTKCDDPDIKVIQEEIFDDNEVLPLWEGKVMGQVQVKATE
ncbi:axin isoform X1 [Bemisia tabaci]|nr:PREDICTED: axin-1 [Bemisia tabaci]